MTETEKLELIREKVRIIQLNNLCTLLGKPEGSILAQDLIETIIAATPGDQIQVDSRTLEVTTRMITLALVIQGKQ